MYISQYIDATMACMEKSGVFNIPYEKWFDAAASVLQNDGSMQVCRLMVSSF